MSEIALRLLRKDEWSMGNGQCPKCHGCQPSPDSNPMGWWTDTVGHVPNCELALAIEELGGIVVWERENKHPSRQRMADLDKAFADSFARSNPEAAAALRKAGLIPE